MITLQGDNRVLTQAQKFTYLTTNYSSVVTSFYVLNATDSAYVANAFLLLGNFGAEDAEIVKISSVNSTTGLITLTSSTIFSHPESTHVTVIPYDQIRFFHTTDTTFNVSTPLTGYINLQPSDWFSTYDDGSFSTGYGWYTFYNSVTTTLSQPSNAIPYVGFDINTTEDILNDFFSLLSNKELKLVTREDALSWANEGYGRMRNKLNLTNVEYTASDITSLSIVAGTIEYDLPDDFDHLITIISGENITDPGQFNVTKAGIDFIPLREAFSYNGVDPRYYIRGFKIGFIPTPGASTTYYYMYLKTASLISLNNDEVNLPNGGQYIIKDFMMYRAYLKFQNMAMAKVFLDSFNNGLNDMIISSVKRDANLDTFGIVRSANV